MPTEEGKPSVKLKQVFSHWCYNYNYDHSCNNILHYTKDSNLVSCFVFCCRCCCFYIASYSWCGPSQFPKLKTGGICSRSIYTFPNCSIMMHRLWKYCRPFIILPWHCFWSNQQTWLWSPLEKKSKLVYCDVATRTEMYRRLLWSAQWKRKNKCTGMRNIGSGSRHEVNTRAGNDYTTSQWSVAHGGA